MTSRFDAGPIVTKIWRVQDDVAPAAGALLLRSALVACGAPIDHEWSKRNPDCSNINVCAVALMLYETSETASVLAGLVSVSRTTISGIEGRLISETRYSGMVRAGGSCSVAWLMRRRFITLVRGHSVDCHFDAADRAVVAGALLGKK